jgi:hypothetical protein
MRGTVVRRLLPVVLAALVLPGCTADPVPPTPPPAEEAPSPLPVTPGVAPPPGATGAPVVGTSTLPPVPVGEDAPFGDTPVVVTAQQVEPVQIEARGPGEVAGPGVRVTVRAENRGADPVDLAGLVVNATYGDAVPASQSSTDPAAPLTGALAPGASAEGVYVFQVPDGAGGPVVIEVGYSGSSNVVLIRT